MTFLYAALMQSMLFTGGTEANYNSAYAAARESGLPLVVLVGADENPDFQAMRDTVMPQLQSSGSLEKVAYASVSTDREAAVAQKMISKQALPQLVMYYQTAAGWQRKELSGPNSADDVTRFIQAGVQEASTFVASRSSTATPYTTNYRSTPTYSTNRSYAPTNSFNGFRSFGGGGRFCIGGS